MHQLTDNNLLQVWEKGRSQTPIYRSIYLLSLLYPNFTIEELLSFSIGERDAGLLYLRGVYFGTILQHATDCPECKEKIEWETPLELLQLQALKQDTSVRFFNLTCQEKTLKIRLPNSQDLLQLLAIEKEVVAIDSLMTNCIIDMDFTTKVPEQTKKEAFAKMAELDPQADINMDIVCPACQHHWLLNFDIIRYLWEEINDWAFRLLQEVALIAKTFGWSEKDILDMSRFRRNLYLNMIRG